MEKVTRQKKVPFYNATHDLEKAFGQQPENYYWNGDMHFNFQGLKIYAELIAQQLFTILERIASNPESSTMMHQGE